MAVTIAGRRFQSPTATRGRHSGRDCRARSTPTLGGVVIPIQMQNNHPNLGELRNVFRPSAIRIWIMGVISLALLMAVVLGALLTLDSFTSLFTQSKQGTFASTSGPLVCLGVSVLCFALFGNFLISDFRKWAASRNTQLTIYENGFTYESKGQIEAYHWDEIKDINFRVIQVHSKHAAPTKVRVIRSVVKRDGTEVNLAETLNLRKITTLLSERLRVR